MIKGMMNQKKRMVSANRARPLIWGSGKENIKDGEGGPSEDPNDPSGGGSAGDGRRGP